MILEVNNLKNGIRPAHDLIFNIILSKR